MRNFKGRIPREGMNRNQRNSAMGLLALTLCCAGGCGSAVDADRTAAEWVLSTHGRVEIDVGGSRRLVDAESKLPSSPFTVRSIAWDIYPGDRNTQVTDADLQKLAGLAGLEQLDLWASEITDAGVAKLQSLSTLQRLQLSQTHITDTGLELLQELSRLREIGLIDTRVTAAGVRRFKRRCPDCKVLFVASASKR